MTTADLSDKAAFVREALDELAAIPQATLAEFLADPTLQRKLRRLEQ